MPEKRCAAGATGYKWLYSAIVLAPKWTVTTVIVAHAVIYYTHQAFSAVRPSMNFNLESASAKAYEY